MAKKIDSKKEMSEAKKVLLKELKAAGLNVGEQAVEEIIKSVFKASTAFIIATPTPVDDFLLPVLPALEKRVLELADKIDGKKEA